MTLGATPLTWFVDATFTGGGVLTGSYTFDASTGAYSNISLASTGVPGYADTTYLFTLPSFPSGASRFEFNPKTGDLTGTPDVFAILASSMTNAGGTIGINSNGANLATCSNAPCSLRGGSPRRFRFGQHFRNSKCS